MNAGGMPPRTPLLFKNSFLANEQENIFGELTVKVVHCSDGE